MDSKLLVLIGLFVLFKVAASQERHVRCYECNRWQVGFFAGGDNNDQCKEPEKDNSPQSGQECFACLTDTRDRTFGWVERKCVTRENKCKNGTVTKSFVDHDFLDLSAVTEYEVQRQCCTTELCNKDPFDTDIGAATSMRVSFFLFATALLFILFQM